MGVNPAIQLLFGPLAPLLLIGFAKISLQSLANLGRLLKRRSKPRYPQNVGLPGGVMPSVVAIRSVGNGYFAVCECLYLKFPV